MLEENLCLYQGKCNDMRDFLQRLESLHALDETNASKQSSNLTSLLQDSKVLYFFSSIALNYLPLFLSVLNTVLVLPLVLDFFCFLKHSLSRTFHRSHGVSR